MITWLRAQLDTDERLAEQSRTLLLIARTERCAVPGSDEEATFRHFARHPPDRVLRQVQAHRAILDQHWATLTQVGWHEETEICNTCRYDNGLDSYAYPCPTIKALLSIYSDRDGYKEEWSS